ncbi:hypothetical protein ABBQ38_003309 [Trebouxia sp. C0009 RCD-2024]
MTPAHWVFCAYPVSLQHELRRVLHSRYSKRRESTDDAHVMMLADQNASDDAEAVNYPLSYQEPEPLSPSYSGAVMNKRLSPSQSR